MCGITGTLVDPQIVFQAAQKANASSIILVHNHPSGNTQPCEADREITKKLKSGNSFLDIPVLDHLIITTDAFYSFADEGII